MGFRATQPVHVAAKLGIADLLQDGPQPVSALAAAVRAHPRALYRLLRALASLGLFAETADGQFQLTALGETLRSNAPGSLRPLALLYGEDWVWNAYGQAAHSVMTGLPAFEHVHGQGLFDYLQAHPEAAATFDRGMTAYSEHEAAAILAAYDFPGTGTIVDVGGGAGALLASILAAHPRARGVLFDQASVTDRARDLMTRAGVMDRCTTEGRRLLRTCSRRRRSLRAQERLAQLGRSRRPRDPTVLSVGHASARPPADRRACGSRGKRTVRGEALRHQHARHARRRARAASI
jgi:hypothetical protein